MSKVIFRPFWSYDVVRTENWLKIMHSQGYVLKKMNFKARLFIFEKTQPATVFYRIIFDKNSNGNLSNTLIGSGFEGVYHSRNYLIVKTTNSNPQISPSYNRFLDRNKKLKHVIGIILLCYLCILAIPVTTIGVIILFILFSGNFIIEGGPPEGMPPPELITLPTYADMIGMMIFALYNLISLALIIWMIYTYFKLRATNSRLEKLCGDSLNLSFTIPKEFLLSKQEEKALRKDKKLIRKIRIAWFYAPDKVAIWLEKMETMGYNLYRMSRIGNSFFFIKGEPRKVKYHIDYQNKTTPQYFNLNKESGWKLIFTSLSRIQAITVWSQEYTDKPPMFYSDKESNLKQVKRYTLTYCICYFPLCALFILLIIKELTRFVSNYGTIDYFNIFIQLIIIAEFGFFALRTIFYYFRVKKSLNNNS